MKKRSKADRQAWWRSLTAEQQADYRYEKLLEKGKQPNWDQLYTEVVQQGHFLT